MKQRTLLIILASCLVIAVCASQRSDARDVSSRSKLLGKWTNQNETKGPAIINITSIDSATGQLKGKYYPPLASCKSGNVIVISFSVSLRTYGSIGTWTGFLKENKIIASSSNVRSNSGYEWDHITATYDVWTKNP